MLCSQGVAVPELWGEGTQPANSQNNWCLGGWPAGQSQVRGADRARGRGGGGRRVSAGRLYGSTNLDRCSRNTGRPSCLCCSLGSWYQTSFRIIHFIVGRGIAQDSHRETEIRDVQPNEEMVALNSGSQTALTQQRVGERELRALSKVPGSKACAGRARGLSQTPAAARLRRG